MIFRQKRNFLASFFTSGHGYGIGYDRGVFPITVNKETDKLLQRCARLAAARQDGIAISPLNQTSSSSNKAAYNILIAKFRKILGCVAIKANIGIRHKRIQLISRTEEGAHRSATQQSTRTYGKFQNKENAWFNSQDDGTYSEYCRYRNAHRTMDTDVSRFF